MNSMKDFYVCDSVSIHWFKINGDHGIALELCAQICFDI